METTRFYFSGQIYVLMFWYLVPLIQIILLAYTIFGYHLQVTATEQDVVHVWMKGGDVKSDFI